MLLILIVNIFPFFFFSSNSRVLSVAEWCSNTVVTINENKHSTIDSMDSLASDRFYPLMQKNP